MEHKVETSSFILLLIHEKLLLMSLLLMFVLPCFNWVQLTHFSLPYVCVGVCFFKIKKMVIVSHCLREYVVVSITCLILLKRYRGFLMEFVKCFYVRAYFPLPCVCVCFSQKKKKKLCSIYLHYLLTPNINYLFLFLCSTF